MAEEIELQIIKDIDKVFDVIYRSAHRTSPANDEIKLSESIKPWLTTVFIESMDSPFPEFEELLHNTFHQIQMRLVQLNFVERHQLSRLHRSFDIRAILQEYYERERQPMGFQQLWKKLRRKCDFDLSAGLLKYKLHQMGFLLITTHTRETVHEHPAQRLARLKYLRTMRNHRTNGRNLVYFREAVVNHMRWNLAEMDPARAETTESVIVYFAATESGLVQHKFVDKDQQTIENYVEWLKSVMASQPSHSLILLEPKVYKDSAVAAVVPNADGDAIDDGGDGGNDEELPMDVQSDDTETDCDASMEKIVTALNQFEIVVMPPNHYALNPTHSADFERILDHQFTSNQNNEPITVEHLKIGIEHRLTTITANEWKQYFANVLEHEENCLRFESFMDDDAISIDDESGESDVEIVDEPTHPTEPKDNEIILL